MARTRPDALADRTAVLVQQNVRPFAGYATDDATGLPVFDFDPALSTAEQATLADLATMARFGVTLTLAEWRAIKTDAANLKAYLGVASPTAAQTAAATKAIIRVLGTIIRN